MFWTVTLSLLQGMRQAAVLFGLTLAFSLPLGLLVALGSMSRCRPGAGVVRRPGVGDPGHASGAAADHHFLRPRPCGRSQHLGQQPDAGVHRGLCTELRLLFLRDLPGWHPGRPGGSAGGRSGAWASPACQIFFKITLLQVVKRILPPMSNEIITLVKDTSLARIIAIVELTKAGEDYVKTAGTPGPLFYTGVYYLLLWGF